LPIERPERAKELLELGKLGLLLLDRNLKISDPLCGHELPFPRQCVRRRRQREIDDGVNAKRGLTFDVLLR